MILLMTSIILFIAPFYYVVTHIGIYGPRFFNTITFLGMIFLIVTMVLINHRKDKIIDHPLYQTSLKRYEIMLYIIINILTIVILVSYIVIKDKLIYPLIAEEKLPNIFQEMDDFSIIMIIILITHFFLDYFLILRKHIEVNQRKHFGLMYIASYYETTYFLSLSSYIIFAVTSVHFMNYDRYLSEFIYLYFALGGLVIFIILKTTSIRYLFYKKSK